MRHFLLCCLMLIAMFLEISAQISFGSPKDILPPINNISYTYTMDVDGDNDNDFLVQYTDKSGLYWYEQTNTVDSFALPKLLPNIQISNNEELQLDDVDGDGDLDIITCGFNSNHISYNEGNGNFTQAYGHSPGARSLYFDYDLDGDRDLVVYTISINYWSIYLLERVNENGIVFNPPIAIYEQYTSDPAIEQHKGIHAIAPWDVDNDGDKDLLVAAKLPELDTEGSSAFWIINDGTFNPSTTYLAPYGLQEFGGIVEQLEVVENNDSESFLVATFIVNPSLYAGTTNLQIFPPPTLNSPFFSIYDFPIRSSIVVYDLDGDGDDDIVTGNENHFWLEQTSTASWIVHEQPPLISSNHLGNFILQEIIDYNQDGIPDKILSGGLGHGRLGSIVFNGIHSDGFIGLIPGSTGENIFGQACSLFPSTGIQANAVIDFDADGDKDILSWEGKWLPDSIVFIMENEAGSIHLPKYLLDFPGFIKNLQFSDNDSIGYALIHTKKDEDSYVDQVYMIQKDGSTNTGWSPPVLVIDSVSFSLNDFEIADIDNDSDFDILHMEVNDLDYIYAVWYENPGSGMPFAKHELIDDPVQPGTTYTRHPYQLVDINTDGLLDIFLKGPDKYAYYLQQSGVLFDFQQPMVLNDGVHWLGHLNTADYDNDGDADILEIKRVQQNDDYISILGIYRFNTNTQQYENFELSQELDYSTRNKVFDIDADGDIDVFTQDGICLNIANAGTFSAPTGRNEPYYPDDNQLIIKTADLNGDGVEDLITLHPEKGLQWIENFTTPEFVFVQGSTFYDDTECQDIVIDTLPYTGLQPKIQWQNNYGNNEVFSTNSEINYLVALPDTGQYLWNLIPPSVVWQSCPEDTIQTYTVYDSLYTLDFQLHPLENCPYIDISIAVGLLRACEDGVIYLNYQNIGTVPSQNQVLHFSHEAGLSIENTSIPPLTQTDTLITFEIPPLDVGISGQIQVVVNPDCATYLPGHVFCFDAVVEQEISCLDNIDEWDGSDLRAKVSCEQDSIVFTLKNEGPGDMALPRQYSLSIVNDDIIMLRIDDVLLEQEDSILLTVKDTTELIRLIVEQDNNHPLYNELWMTVDGCLTSDTSNILNQQLLQNPNTNYGLTGIQICRELRGAYDPNLKEAFPVGEGPDHEIPVSSWIDYTVHFQNTGNDTAFLVVLRDTLPECLDLTSLRMGASSHPYEWILHENRELSITFDPIALPDSNVNQIGSQGFVHYKIKTLDNCQPGTLIKNRAGIYFDYNPVVLTDYVWHTIKKPIIYSSELIIHCLENGPPIADSLQTIIYSYDYYDSLVLVQNKFVVPDTNYSTLEFTSGTIWEDIEIVTDTTIMWLLTNEYGCDSLLIYEFNIASTKDHQLFNLGVFPNPASDQLFVSIPNFNAGYHLELYEITGSLVWRGEHRHAHSEIRNLMIPIKDLPDGIYNLRLKGDHGQQAATRVIIKR